MPLISVIMCNFNCAAYLPAAIFSALQQQLVEIEVIVVDDGSTDASRDIVERMATDDPRVHLVKTPTNLGPAGARNLGLAIARGDWIAIQDSDDLMHPERLARLIGTAERRQVDIVADDLLAFDDAQKAPAYAIVDGFWSTDVIEMPMETYIHSNALYTRAPTLGYLKPVFRASILRHGLRYNESLRIAEDFDLVLRMMALGHRLIMTPDLTYFYRRRNTSISHRLAPEAVAAMRMADAQFRADFPNLTPRIVRALNRRMENLGRTLGFEKMIDRLKARDLSGFAAVAREHPDSLPLLRLPVLARLGRMFGRKEAGSALPPDDGRNISFITRQRIVGPTNGSSTYALSMLNSLRDQQFRLHYICPSPAVFGSWPVLKLRPEMAIFDTIAIRGGWRRGNLIFATDPMVLLRIAGRVAEAVAIKARLLKTPILGPAPYSIAAPLLQKDQLFLASHAPARADQIICDYAFLNSAIPYVLRPEAKSMVVMHDLFSSREVQFAGIGGADSVTSLDRDHEMRLLGAADLVVAIQSEEAAVVARHLGPERVIVAPMAMNAVATPQAGSGSGQVLFVGSKTAPNVDALNWFLADIWPKVLKDRPDATFDIVGSAGTVLSGEIPDGVVVHGLVATLDRHYRDADVVVSPLRVGSGLKIKLVEALACGKAIVATSVTCQGVEAEVDGAVIVTDDADETARHIVRLLDDPLARAALADRALTAAREQFGEQRCYAGVVAFALANARAFEQRQA